MEDLQNLAGKIEELKEKLTDGEYKGLLDVAKECYDKKEKAKKKFIKVMCITSTISSSIVKDDTHDPDSVRCGIECLWWDYGEDSDDCNYNGPLNKIGVVARVQQSQQIILFEVTTRAGINGFCIDMKNCKMTEYAYDNLLKDKYMVDDGHQISPLATFVYLSHYEL
jgi:hypothetical protein